MAGYASVQLGGCRCRLAVCKGIRKGELVAVLEAAFPDAAGQLVGVEELSTGLVYPLSAIGWYPERFHDRRYKLLVCPQPRPRRASVVSSSSSSDSARAVAEHAHEAQSPVCSPRVQDTDSVSSEGSFEGDKGERRRHRLHKDQDIQQLLQRGKLRAQDTLVLIQEHTRFGNLDIVHLMQIFREAAHSGDIDRTTFRQCLRRVLHSKDPVSDTALINLVTERIFDVFDRTGNGRVSLPEFMTGLSLLCRAPGVDKIRAAFNLFDQNRDGFITLSEMDRYLSAFFEVCFALDPTMRARFDNATPIEVAMETAEYCFQKADRNRDGRISFEEFEHWYTSDDSWAQFVVPQ